MKSRPQADRNVTVITSVRRGVVARVLVATLAATLLDRVGEHPVALPKH